MKLREMLGFRKKVKEKPLSKRIDEAIDVDIIRKYMYMNRGIDFLIFYKKGNEWDVAESPKNCISNEIRSKLKEIFSKHVPLYEQLYNDVRHEIDKIKYTRNDDCSAKAVELEFCSSHASFMTMEHQRIIRDRMMKSMEEEKKR